MIKKLYKFIKNTIINILIIFAILALIEGSASLLTVIHHSILSEPIAESKYTEYDPELGWYNKSNIYIPDIYGKNVSIKTNDDGFRSDYNFSEKKNPNKTRIICSGDSFTFGYGVDNEHTWSNVLTKIDTSLETINAGHGGYGMDQSFLLFKRFSDKYEYDYHIFAFITADIFRMYSKNFLGYGKPILKIKENSLAVENVPVPKNSNLKFPRLLSKIKPIFELSITNLIKKLFNKFNILNNTNLSNENKNNISHDEMKQVIFQMFKELKEIDDNNNAQLYIVHLPTQYSITDGKSKAWSEYIDSVSTVLNINYLDISAKASSIRNDDYIKLFLTNHLKYKGASGHLSNIGNEIVANYIYNDIFHENIEKY